MPGDLRARSDQVTPARSDEIAALLAARGPLSLEVLARLVNVAPGVLGRHLAEHPHLVPTPEGAWVSGLRLADGVAFMHELCAVEVASGMLSADDDLALWAQFAVGGLRLAGGGEVQATTVLDLPPGIGGDLPAGQGMIGQLLAGPDGWLAGFSAGDLLSVRLRDGVLEISAGKPAERTAGAERMRDVCALAAVEALKRYVEGTVDGVSRQRKPTGYEEIGYPAALSPATSRDAGRWMPGLQSEGQRAPAARSSATVLSKRALVATARGVRPLAFFAFGSAPSSSRAASAAGCSPLSARQAIVSGVSWSRTGTFRSNPRATRSSAIVRSACNGPRLSARAASAP
jgi:hypothetical protein